MIIPIAFSFAVSWCFLVGFSRMDLGRNTPADVIAGHLLGHMMIGAWVLCGDYIDEMLVKPYSALPWLIPTFFALCLMRSEEHTSELQSLMRISYAVFCLKKKNQYTNHRSNNVCT